MYTHSSCPRMLGVAPLGNPCLLLIPAIVSLLASLYLYSMSGCVSSEMALISLWPKNTQFLIFNWFCVISVFCLARQTVLYFNILVLLGWQRTIPLRRTLLQLAQLREIDTNMHERADYKNNNRILGDIFVKNSKEFVVKIISSLYSRRLSSKVRTLLNGIRIATNCLLK